MVYVQDLLDRKLRVNTCVIIPTYNEAKSIGSIVKSIRSQNLEVLVVDDGSKDGTYKVAADNGAVVVRNFTNLGKGASLIKGFDYALERDFDAVITMDGDGQHLPEEIPFFIRQAAYSTGHIFIGNRMQKTRKMPFLRVYTNKFMSWFISLIAKQDIPDTQCGFRLIKKEALKKLDLLSSRFEIESEILVKGSRLGFKIESIPVKSVYSEEKSSINPIVDTIRFFRFAMKELFCTKK